MSPLCPSPPPLTLLALTLPPLPSCFPQPDLDIHLNFPSCEAEKNGPSAGATIATSLVLLLTGAKLRPKIAISGEINMRGALLPIGNVKEKVAAASCQGITHIVLPSANIKQFRRLPAKTRGNIKAIKADHMCEVIRHAVESPSGQSTIRSRSKPPVI